MEIRDDFERALRVTPRAQPSDAGLAAPVINPRDPTVVAEAIKAANPAVALRSAPPVAAAQPVAAPDAGPIGPPEPFAKPIPPVGAENIGVERPDLYAGTPRAAETISAISKKQGPTDVPPVGAPYTGIENPANYPAAPAPAAASPATPAAAPREAPAAPAEKPPVEGGEPAFGGETGGVPPKAAPKEKNFGEKIGALAKKIGVPLLHLLQAGAYGAAGIDSPTALETLKKEQAERQKTEEGRAFDREMRAKDQEFMQTISEIQMNFQRDMAAAGTKAEQDAAVLAAQNQMERLKVEGAQAEQRAKIMAGEGKPTFEGFYQTWK